MLEKLTPRATNLSSWALALTNATLLYGIAADRAVLVEFMAQACHESAGLTRLQESLTYSAERLVQVWPRRFPTLAAAAPYANAPHALASHVYAGRMGNGDEASGEGWTYRGRGLFMVTGKDNYRAVARALNDPAVVSCPDRLCQRNTAAAASAVWWTLHPELGRLAVDEPDDDDEADFVSITRRVNGGTEGLASRRRWRDAWRAVL